jgi:hypothetical protein
MTSKPDHTVGRVWLWSKNKNSLVRITPSFSRMPTFGPTVFDPKPKNHRRSRSLSLSKAINKSRSLSLYSILSFRLLYKPVPFKRYEAFFGGLPGDLLSLTGGGVFSHATGIRAKFDFAPDFFPFLAPHEWATADDTWLGGQVGFLPHLGHPNTSTAIGVKSTG